MTSTFYSAHDHSPSPLREFPPKKSKQLFIPIDFITFHGTFQGGFVGFKLHTNAASDVQPVRAVGWHTCPEAKQIAREKHVF